MKSFSTIIFAAIALFISSTLTIAQSNSLAADNRLTDRSGGYSFAPPSGWIKKEGDGGFAMINPAKTVIIAVKGHNYRDFNSFAANNNLADEGLQQIGEMRDLDGGGKFFRAGKQTSEGVLIVDTLVLFSPHGGGVAIASITDQTNAGNGLQAAVEIAQSLRFSKPQESAVSSEWQTYLRGKHLLYLNTSGSFSDRIDIYLCPSGSFYYQSNTAGFSRGGVGIGTLASENKNRGTWRVTSRGGDQLILEFASGEIYEYTLQQRQTGGGISLNGRRYFVQTDAGCQ